MLITWGPGFIFMILGLGAGDPQVPTWRGSRLGFEVPPEDPRGTPGIQGKPGGDLWGIPRGGKGQVGV